MAARSASKVNSAAGQHSSSLSLLPLFLKIPHGPRTQSRIPSPDRLLDSRRQQQSLQAPSSNSVSSLSTRLVRSRIFAEIARRRPSLTYGLRTHDMGFVERQIDRNRTVVGNR